MECLSRGKIIDCIRLIIPILILSACCLPLASDSHAEAVHLHPEFGRQECTACHDSPHRPTWPKTCRDCHSTNATAFHDAQNKMTPKRHGQLTGFRLEPPHDEMACSTCHSPDLPFDEGHAMGVLSTCENCHETPHGEQFHGRHRHCLECHDRGSFRPGDFTLDRHTVFPLEGFHRAVACVRCHTTAEGTASPRFVGTPKKCAACHRDPHRRQLGNKPDCARCHHSTHPWTKPRFNHDTAFVLGNAHRALACDRCHPRVRQPDGASVMQFKLSKRECGDVHGK